MDPENACGRSMYTTLPGEETASLGHLEAHAVCAVRDSMDSSSSLLNEVLKHTSVSLLEYPTSFVLRAQLIVCAYLDVYLSLPTLS